MSLPDVIQKSQIIEQCRVVRKELDDSTLPVFKAAVGVFNKNDLTEPVALLQETFEKITGKRIVIIDEIGKELPELTSNLKAIEEFVQKNFNEDIVKASISLKEINVIQYVGITQFVSQYARKLLAYFYTAQSSLKYSSGIKFDESFSQADIQWIKDNFLDFVNALEALTTKTSNLERLLDNVPDIRVNPENVRSVLAIQSNSKVDPLKLQYFNVTNNFFYRYMLKWAESQADSYKLALEEKRMLEYRSLLLKRQRDGKPDARLEKEITITENRISRLTYKIRKMEQDND